MIQIAKFDIFDFDVVFSENSELPYDTMKPNRVF